MSGFINFYIDAGNVAHVSLLVNYAPCLCVRRNYQLTPALYSWAFQLTRISRHRRPSVPLTHWRRVATLTLWPSVARFHWFRFPFPAYRHRYLVQVCPRTHQGCLDMSRHVGVLGAFVSRLLQI